MRVGENRFEPRQGWRCAFSASSWWNGKKRNRALIVELQKLNSPSDLELTYGRWHSFFTAKAYELPQFIHPLTSQQWNVLPFPSLHFQSTLRRFNAYVVRIDHPRSVYTRLDYVAPYLLYVAVSHNQSPSQLMNIISLKPPSPLPSPSLSTYHRTHTRRWCTGWSCYFSGKCWATGHTYLWYTWTNSVAQGI